MPTPFPNAYRTPESAPPEGGDALLAVDVQTLLGWLRSGLTTIAATTVIGIVVALAFGFATAPRYTSTAELIVDPGNLHIVPDDLYAGAQQRQEPILYVNSKLRLLKSRNVLKRTVVQLDLQNDPEFVKPPSPLDIRTWLFAATPRDPELVARESLAKRVGVNRDERSFGVTVSVWSYDADKAARINEALVEAFQDELAAGEAEGAAQVSQGLIDRLDELRADVTAAEDAVEEFRRENDLLVSEGELINSRSMSELNQQTVAAQARLSRAQARHETLTAVANDPQANSSVLQSGTISALRQQYATLSRAQASLEQDYGPLHPRRADVSSQLRNIEQQIAAETRRIVRAAEDDVEEARANLQLLRADTDVARSAVAQDNEAEIRLRELQRDATAKAAVYEAFLARASQVTERQQIDATNVRVISPAVVPADASWPPRKSILAIVGMLAGFGVGTMIAIGRGLAADLRRPPNESQAYRASAVTREGEPVPQPAAVYAGSGPAARAAQSDSYDRSLSTSSRQTPASHVARHLPDAAGERARRSRTTPARRAGSLLDYL